jgi:hypothetical protein
MKDATAMGQGGDASSRHRFLAGGLGLLSVIFGTALTRFEDGLPLPEAFLAGIGFAVVTCLFISLAAPDLT